MFTASFMYFSILLLTLLFLLYKYVTRHYDYFTKRKMKFEKPVPFLGNLLPVITMKTTIGEWLRDLYNKIDDPYFGIFILDEPYVVIKSPELIKQVLIKDFNKFSDRIVLAAKHNDILTNMLFFQKNPDWRKVRTKMAPVFTSGKLKNMFHEVNNIGKDLNKYIKNNLGTLESKEVAAKFSTEIIARCAFAIHAHCFDTENSTFRQIGRTMFGFTWRNAVSQTACFIKPELANFFRLEFFEKCAIGNLREIFWNAIKKREQINITKSSDLVDIIVEMRKNKKLCDEVDFEGDKAVAQAVQFFAAGFETTSSTISFTLYELCLQPKIQDRLRQEIIDNKNEHNGFTYEGLKNLKYMDMCIYETLRKYPVLPFLDRRCNEDCKLVGTDLVIEKGTPVYIPMLGLHYDEKYFPQPEKYDPERFVNRNSYNENGLYYMPFGEGPRICIGERFGMLGVKVGLLHILSEFIVEKVDQTPVPVKFSPKSVLIQSDVGLQMRFKEYVPTPA